jgi:transketolase
MRTAFVARLSELAEQNSRLFLVTGDLGFGVLDDFQKRFPKQYLNVGVAEQNMAAVATGLAIEGFVVFTYSIGNFPTLRCLEQLRNDAFYHEANVKVVSIGGGFSYGQLGMSHHATEDLSIMRALPGVAVCAPGSRFETTAAVGALIERDGPCYLRLERAAADFSDDAQVEYEFGKARVLREGRDISLIASGGIVAEAVAAAESLAATGIEARVISMHTVKPFDDEAIGAAAEQTGGIVTIEENSILGGLAGAVAESCLENGFHPKRFKRLGIRDRFMSEVGDQDYLRRTVGIDRANIHKQVGDLLKS